MLTRSSRILASSLSALFFITSAWPQNESRDSNSDLVPADEDAFQLNQEFETSELASAFGAYFDPETREQIIVLPANVNLSAAEQGMRGMGNAARRLRQSRLTLETQAQLEKLIVERRYHPEARKYSMGAYFDLRSGKQVLITDAPMQVTLKLLRAYSDQVDVQPGSIITDASRNADRPLFSGASGIKGYPDGGYCTSAWKVRRGTIPGLLTAGHCQGPNAPYHVDTWDAYTFGTLSTMSLNPDVGFIYWNISTSPGWRDQYRPYIYVGSVNSTSTKPVYGGRDPSLNTNIYYRSGAVTGEISGLTVTSLSASYTDQNGVTHTNAMAYTSPTAAQGGDSGAPIYVYSTGGGGIHVRGIHTARATNGTHFGEKYSRAMFSGSTLLCYTTCYTGS